MSSTHTSDKPQDRRPYTPPQLEVYGDVRTLTAGQGKPPNDTPAGNGFS